MGDQLFQYSLKRLTFSDTTQLRFYHNDFTVHTTTGEDWKSAKQLEEEIQLVDTNLRSTYNARSQDATSPSKPSISLFLGLGNGKESPLSVERNVLLEVINRHHLPKVLLQCMMSNNGGLACFTESGMVNGALETTHLLLANSTPYSPYRDFSFALRLNLQNGSLTGIFFDKDEYRLDDLVQTLRIQRPEIEKNPILILIVLLEDYGYDNEFQRKTLDKEVVKLEKQTGMTSLRVDEQSLSSPSDYEFLARQMHSCNTDLIFLENLLRFESLLGTLCGKVLSITQPYKAIFNASQAEQRLAFCMTSSELRLIQMQSLKFRVQSQINLLYSLISQRDSKINLMVAEDSQRIAEAAQRDSRVMRTIGLMTLIFLPGTLVASIFSTNVIDLRADETAGHSNIIARLWWIFALTTALVTFLVLAIWRFWHKRIERSEKPRALQLLDLEKRQ